MRPLVEDPAAALAVPAPAPANPSAATTGEEETRPAPPLQPTPPPASAEAGRWALALVSASLVYYHCAVRGASVVSLVADVAIVVLCSLAILGLLFRQIHISVPVDPLEWQISQETATRIVACLANTVGAAESVLRVAASGHDKRLFVKVVLILYFLSSLGRVASGATIAYAGLWVFCLYIFVQKSHTIRKLLRIPDRQDSGGVPDPM